MKPRLLVIELHHLGDAVLSIPFLRAASDRYEVSVYATAPVAQMLRVLIPQVETFVAQPKWPARWRQAAGELRRWQPEVTVGAWSDARAAMIARLTGATKRLGFPMTEANYYASQHAWRNRRLKTGQRIESVARLLGQDLLTAPLYRASALDSHFSNWKLLAAALNLQLPVDFPWFTVPETSFPDDLLSFLNEQQRTARPLWVVHPGGRLPTKRWPLERFQALLQDLFAARNWPVLIINPPNEGTLEPVGALQRSFTCETHAHLARALSCASFVLCNDSYPAHLAAALGKRVFSIFGSGEPAWFAPFANATRVIQNDVCPHHPCVDRCVMPSVVCLEAIAETQVAQFLVNFAPGP